MPQAELEAELGGVVETCGAAARACEALWTARLDPEDAAAVAAWLAAADRAVVASREAFRRLDAVSPAALGEAHVDILEIDAQRVRAAALERLVDAAWRLVAVPAARAEEATS